MGFAFDENGDVQYEHSTDDNDGKKCEQHLITFEFKSTAINILDNRIFKSRSLYSPTYLIYISYLL